MRCMWGRGEILEYKPLRTTKHFGQLPVRLGHLNRRFGFFLLGEKRRFGFFGGPEVSRFGFLGDSERVGLGFFRGPVGGRFDILPLLIEQDVGPFGVGARLRGRLLLPLVQQTIGLFGVGEVFGFGLLLRRLFLDLGLNQVGRSSTFQLHFRSLGLDLALQFGIFGLGLATGLDLRELDAHVEFGFGRGQPREDTDQFDGLASPALIIISLLGFGFGLLALALGFEHGGLRVDFADFLSCFALLFRLTHLPDHASLSDIDLGLIRSTFVSLAAQEREIFAARGVLKLLHVGIIALQLISMDKLSSIMPRRLTFADRIGSVRFARFQSPWF